MLQANVFLSRNARKGSFKLTMLQICLCNHSGCVQWHSRHGQLKAFADIATGELTKLCRLSEILICSDGAPF